MLCVGWGPVWDKCVCEARGSLIMGAEENYKNLLCDSDVVKHVVG